MSRWEQQDVADYDVMESLAIVHDFWSPEEEFACKKGREKRRELKRGRRDHNDGAIKRARVQVACLALCIAFPRNALMRRHSHASPA